MSGKKQKITEENRVINEKLDIKIDRFGNISSSVPIDKINQLLDEKNKNETTDTDKKDS